MSAVSTIPSAHDLDGLLREKWCHVGDPETGRALCGCPLTGDIGPHYSRPGDICDGCGRRSCPDCQMAWRERMDQAA